MEQRGMPDATCPFCAPEASRIFHAGPLTLGLWDAFPVNPGHALIVTKRHIETWFEATNDEQSEILSAIEVARTCIEAEHQPDGYNIGINVAEAAGQTVWHLHVHVIPRYTGDVEQPRGGVRNVIPKKGDYLTGRGAQVASEIVTAPTAALNAQSAEETGHPPHSRALVSGGDDALHAHILAHLANADRADCAVAFVLTSGVRLLEGHFSDLLDRGGHLRILTGDYLGVTEPEALLRLLDLHEAFPEQIELRVFETGSGTFHPKAYIFAYKSGAGVALVGSSNLSRPALLDGLEWNFRSVTSRDQAGFADVSANFEELFHHANTTQLTPNWVDSYRLRRPNLEATPGRELALPDEEPIPVPDPHVVQTRALEALELTRLEGNRAGLVVMATGLGKTWLAAFDSTAAKAQRILFVAHREEILQQAMSTFRRIRPDATLGLYSGKEKKPDADVVFGSIQTVGRKNHLGQFAPDEFDYIVVDEFHHAAARSYRQLINYFEPKFLLGLTATPERTDGGDLLALCQNNLVYRCDLAEGIEEGLLAPFHYYGVPDEVDYTNIPWRSSRFDEEELTKAVATQSRAQNALEQHQNRAGKRTLAFCCSKRHADFMRDYFEDAGIPSAAVHSDPSSDPRSGSLEDLKDGKLSVIFAVDMFNEGVDLPSIDTIMMLRPTESRILWLQQFGRGLRKADDEGKEQLKVIDYIGNHRNFLLKPQTLFQLPPGDTPMRELLLKIEHQTAELPNGCEVTYELETIEILRSLLRQQPPTDFAKYLYEAFKELHGRRPTASELHFEGGIPRSFRQSHGSWFNFVDAMGDLEADQSTLIANGSSRDFVKSIETTPMTKSFKMLVLQSMIDADAFPGRIEIDQLCAGVRHIAIRSARLKAEFDVSLDEPTALRRYMEGNPIKAWTGGRGTGQHTYFVYSNGFFETTFPIPSEQQAAYVDLVRELADWRLVEYLDRNPEPKNDAGFICRVNRSGDRPILFPLDRDDSPSIPEGWTPIILDGEAFEANFVKVAVNVVRRPGSDENVLPEILMRWFGEDAGRPGSNHSVEFSWPNDLLALKPINPKAVSTDPRSIVVGQSYKRDLIAGLFGVEYKEPVWRQGYIHIGQNIFLLVTLDKSKQPAEHKYEDKFLSREIFEWKSQNRHTQGSNAGQAISKHSQKGIEVHLFVRKTSKVANVTAPFIYCGDVDFVDWEGDQPITIRWRLKQELSDASTELFEIE
jgi:superfamily II DNA or RNA helicase/HKD family nuclease/diadenosine tetraphosphate (Ap4A) HIT family hydrolase